MKPTLMQRILHFLGLCPRQRIAHHPCSGLPGRCGWEDKR